ncbi:MAG: HhH-GPD family protein [Rickettsiales bacterium]|jgi:DNA-3-methyladenine glycosylase II|nr:HhH-GPD family protein [Rickettsiales bacterium]
MNQGTFILKTIPPFRLDFTAWTLRRRASNVIDRWDGTAYRRVLMIGNAPVEVAVVQVGTLESPNLQVAAQTVASVRDIKHNVTAALERLLGLHVDLAEFYKQASDDPELHLLAQRFYGMKPPRFASVFEAVINAIACQQLTLTLGIELLNRLTRKYGSVFAGETGNVYSFPQPENLAALSPNMLRDLGFSRQKGKAIIALARSIAEGSEDLEKLESMSDDEATAYLCKLHGIGRWSAEYVLLRGLGRVHIFPGDDVGARNNLQRWMKVKDSLDYDAVREVLAHRRPYGGLIYFHLLLDRLAEKGLLRTPKQAKKAPITDCVDEADNESFPANNPAN